MHVMISSDMAICRSRWNQFNRIRLLRRFTQFPYLHGNISRTSKPIFLRRYRFARVCHSQLVRGTSMCLSGILRDMFLFSCRSYCDSWTLESHCIRNTSVCINSPCANLLCMLSLSGHLEFHETCHSVTFYVMKKDSKRCCDTTTLESIHTKDESKRGSAFAFIFGVNWPVQWM